MLLGSIKTADRSDFEREQQTHSRVVARRDNFVWLTIGLRRTFDLLVVLAGLVVTAIAGVCRFESSLSR